MECARVLVTTSLFASIAFASMEARAEDGGLRLAWSAPPGCPTSDDVKAATLRSVDPEKMLRGTLLADASVEQLGAASWRVRLKTRRGDNAGEREIEGPTCAGVADAMAVILALALMPPTTIGADVPPKEESAAPPPPPEAEKPKPAAPPAKEHVVAAGIAFAADAGSLPKLGAGAALTLAWTPWRLRIEAEGKLLGGQTANVSGKPVSANFGLKQIGGRGCFVVAKNASFDVAPCVGMGAAIMSADGMPNEALRVTGASTTKVWASFEGGVIGRYFFANWLALRARAAAVVPLYQYDFRVDGQGRVFQSPRIGADATFGAEVLFL